MLAVTKDNNMRNTPNSVVRYIKINTHTIALMVRDNGSATVRSLLYHWSNTDLDVLHESFLGA